MRTLPFYLILIIATGCNRYISDHIPTVEYRGLKIKSLEPKVTVDPPSFSTSIHLQLAFRYTNPFKKDLKIPNHQFIVRMKNAALPNGKEIAQLNAGKNSFLVKENADTIIHYNLDFNLDPNGFLKDFLGWDNYFEFESKIKVDLKDYATGNLGKALQKVGNTSKEFTLAFGDSIRLPLPPAVETSNELAKIAWIGETDKIDLTPLKNGMSPFVNLLFNAKVKVFQPTITDPFKLVDTTFADYMLNLLKPLFPDATTTWGHFKNFWAQFEATPVIDFPGSKVTGLEIKMPFTITNENHFAIESPQLELDAKLNSSYTPLTFDIAPDQGKMIGPLEKKKMYVTTALHWNESFSLQGLLAGKLLPNNPSVQGTMNMDIGFGMISIPIKIVVPFKLGQ